MNVPLIATIIKTKNSMKYLYVKPVFLWLSAVSVMFLGACTNEIPDTPEATEAISFSVPQTRAAIESVNDMSAFSVWGWYDADTTPFAVFDNTTVEKTAGGWNYTDYVRYWSPGKTYDFYAVHPENVSNVNVNPQKGTITITDFDSSTAGENAVDLMTATNKGVSGDEAPVVDMKFQHALTRIRFSAKLADGLDGYSLQVSEVALWASKKGTMTFSDDKGIRWETEPYLVEGDNEEDIVNGNYNAYLYHFTSAAGELISTPINTVSPVLLNVEDKGDLLVIPQNMSETRPVLAVQYTLSYGGITTSKMWKVFYLKDTPTNWTPGDYLNYTFTIGENNVYFSVQVGDWKDGNSDNENVDFE